MQPGLKWYGEEFKRRLHIQVVTGLRRIGRSCVDAIKGSMGTSPSSPGEPPGTGPGATYRRSIDYTVNERRMICRVGTNDERGPWLELGTGSRARFGGSAYLIVPKEARVLMWQSRSGETIIARRVMHPGIHPRPHIVPGVRSQGPKIERILKEAVTL